MGRNIGKRSKLEKAVVTLEAGETVEFLRSARESR